MACSPIVREVLAAVRRAPSEATPVARLERVRLARIPYLSRSALVAILSNRNLHYLCVEDCCGAKVLPEEYDEFREYFPWLDTFKVSAVRMPE